MITTLYAPADGAVANLTVDVDEEVNSTSTSTFAYGDAVSDT